MNKYTLKLMSLILLLAGCMFLVLCSTLAWFSYKWYLYCFRITMNVTDGNNLIISITDYNLTWDANLS